MIESLDDDQLRRLREALLARQRSLVEGVRAAEAKRRAGERDVSEVRDSKDLSEAFQTGERDAAHERLELDELDEVNAALARLQSNTYGQCADCGEAIAAQRLSAQPTAQRCTACQRAVESARRG